MRRFFDLLEERIAIGDARQTREERRVNQEKLHPHVYFPAAYPEEVLVRLEELLGRAADLVEGDGRATRWLELTVLQFRYLKIVATGFNLHLRHESKPTAELKRRIREAIEARAAFLKELDAMKQDPARLRDWFPGWELYMSNAPSGGAMWGRIDHFKPFGGT
jgi:hypothetical protein